MLFALIVMAGVLLLTMVVNNRREPSRWDGRQGGDGTAGDYGGWGGGDPGADCGGGDGGGCDGGGGGGD